MRYIENLENRLPNMRIAAVFNQTCLNENWLPTFTNIYMYTRTRTVICIFIFKFALIFLNSEHNWCNLIILTITWVYTYLLEYYTYYYLYIYIYIYTQLSAGDLQCIWITEQSASEHTSSAHRYGLTRKNIVIIQRCY